MQSRSNALGGRWISSCWRRSCLVSESTMNGPNRILTYQELWNPSEFLKTPARSLLHSRTRPFSDAATSYQPVAEVVMGCEAPRMGHGDTQPRRIAGFSQCL